MGRGDRGRSTLASTMSTPLIVSIVECVAGRTDVGSPVRASYSRLAGDSILFSITIIVLWDEILTSHNVGKHCCWQL